MTSPFLVQYGPWAIVAGASEGLGAAFASALAARGLHLILLARRADVLETLAAQLRRTHAIEVRTQVIDLGGPELSEVLGALVAELEIGLAVYNAAFAPVGEVLDQAPETLLRVVDVNVRGPLIFARTLAPKMVSRGRGGLVLMSSMAGFQGAPRIATYAASKAFTTVLGESLWSELKPKGVDVVVSCAGAIRTPNYASTSTREAPGTLEAREVAEASIVGLGRGPTVVPGATNQFARVFLGRMLSRRAAVGVMARSTNTLSKSEGA